MPAKRLLLWGGLALSVLACALSLVGGALAVFFMETGSGITPVGLRRVLLAWAVSFAGTFALSVVFFTFMLRRGWLGR